MRHALGAVAFVVVAACCATSASAQQATDYAVSQYTVGSKYESPQAGATTLTLPGTGDDNHMPVTLPFAFTFFGTSYTSAYVSTNGWISFTTTPSSTTSGWYGNSGFPFVDVNLGSALTGAICPYWDDLYVTGSGTMKTWTSGSSPNRRFVVSWEGVTNFPLPNSNSFTFQVQLHETSNSIVFAYVPGSTWYATSSYTVGIEAADGTRYQYPGTLSDGSNAGQPANDYSFDLPKVYFAGKVLYDRYVVDGTGVGNTSQQNLVLAGFRVEARNAAGATVGVGTTGATGDFNVEVAGVPPLTTGGSIVVCSQNSVCAVRAQPGGALYATPIATGVAFALDHDFGTLTLHEGTDPGGVGRQPLNIARTIQTVYDWAKARTTDPIPFIEVLYSTSSSFPTAYTAKVGTTTPATMRIGGAASNPDAWDVSVIRKTYGRHVCGSISPDPTTTYGSAYDSVTDPTNAFCEGFGYYLNAVISGDRKYFDGVNATTTNVLDLENSNSQSRKGDDVAAWVAQALFDLTDPDDEPWDVFAGAGTAGENVFKIVDAMTAAPKATTFFDAWLAAGYDGAALSQNFIHHGLLADDVDEPNDGPTTAAFIAKFGFIRDDRVLNLFNHDWYEFELKEDTPTMTASVVFDRGRYASADVLLQLVSAGGTVLGTGAAADTSSPFKIVTGALPAGVYRLHVALNSGGPVGAYSVQAFPQLEFKSAAFRPWTVGRPYNVPLAITGGIPPYILTVPPAYEGPTGLTLDGDNAFVLGTPIGPAGGVPTYGSYAYSFLLTASDSARPSNQAQRLQTFVLNDIVRSRFSEFVTFAKGKRVDRAWPPVGGTAPYVVAVDAGALPVGIDAVAGADLRFVGTSAAPGATPFTITVTDVAGSAASTLTTAVVCVPPGPADLAAGPSACGFWFDAVKGVSAGLTISTAKKKPVRQLRAFMYGADGTKTLSVNPKVGKGKVSFAKFIAPTSGRYYFVVASDDSLGTTTLNCVAKTTNPTSGKGDAGTFSFGGTDTTPIAVGVLKDGTLTLTVKPDRKSGLKVKLLELRNPAGVPVALGPTEVKVAAKTNVLTLTRKVDASGTWTAVVGAESGPRGTFTYTYKLKQPKGVVYVAD